MPLDLARISGQIERMSVDQTGLNQDRLEAARSAYQNVHNVDLAGRLRTARTSWLLARTNGRFRLAAEAPAPPASFTVIASDGSFILPDRHSPLRFYVLNTSCVLLRYGDDPLAELSSEPALYFDEADLWVSNNIRRLPVNASLVGLKRAVTELEVVTERALRVAGPVLALQDGTLILWSLESQPDFVADWALEPYLAAMRKLRDAGIPLASYISAPGSSDMLNSLRVSVCDYPEMGKAVNCDDCRSRIPDGRVPACDNLPNITDATLLGMVDRLKPGERSQVFASSSKVLTRYDPDLAINFFYLHTGTEIARVEIPQWVAEDASLLDLTQAIIYDQCRRGRGYPPVLQEAHEQAVIGVADRRMVETLVDRALAEHSIVMQRSGKDSSKRGRFV